MDEYGWNDLGCTWVDMRQSDEGLLIDLKGCRLPVDVAARVHTDLVRADGKSGCCLGPVASQRTICTVEIIQGRCGQQGLIPVSGSTGGGSRSGTENRSQQSEQKNETRNESDGVSC